MTGLRGREQRALGRIEQPLASDDPRLASMFTIFATMTRYEPMPVTERLQPRRWLRRAWAITSVALSTPSAVSGIWAYDARWRAWQAREQRRTINP